MRQSVFVSQATVFSSLISALTRVEHSKSDLLVLHASDSGRQKLQLFSQNYTKESFVKLGPVSKYCWQGFGFSPTSGAMTLIRITLGRMRIDIEIIIRMTFDRIMLSRMTIAKIKIHRMTLGRMTLSRMIIDQNNTWQNDVWQNELIIKVF